MLNTSNQAEDMQFRKFELVDSKAMEGTWAGMANNTNTIYISKYLLDLKKLIPV